MGELKQSPVAILASEMAREGSELRRVAVGGDASRQPPHQVSGFPALIGGADDFLRHALRDAEDPIEQLAGKQEIGVGADSMIPSDRLRDPSLHPLALHHDDAHRHFLPLSGFRFESPISYWDPAHYGLVFGAVELAGVVVGSIVLIRRGSPWRVLGLLCLAIYAAFGVFALTMWAG